MKKYVFKDFQNRADMNNNLVEEFNQLEQAGFEKCGRVQGCTAYKFRHYHFPDTFVIFNIDFQNLCFDRTILKP